MSHVILMCSQAQQPLAWAEAARVRVSRGVETNGMWAEAGPGRLQRDTGTGRGRLGCLRGGEEPVGRGRRTPAQGLCVQLSSAAATLRSLSLGSRGQS